MASRPGLIRLIATCVFCDSGAMIPHADIASALDADRGAGFRDPLFAEVDALVQGGDDGVVPAELRAAHPALNVLLQRETM